MNFTSIPRAGGKADQYAIRSECGNYSVARVIVWAVTWYEAWHGTQFLGRDKDAETAKHLCATHSAIKP